MTGPVVYAEVAFDTDPKVRPADVDYTDLRTEGAGLRSFSCQRGSPVRGADTETGTASATVDNRTRALDPGNDESPWSPNVKPRRRIRFVEDISNRIVFTGFIERLVPSWRQGDGTVDVQAFDLFGLIAGETLPPSVLQLEIEGDGATAHWPLGESSGVWADDVIGASDGSWNTPVGGGDGVPFDPRPAQVLKLGTLDGRLAGQYATTSPVAFTESFSLEMCFRWLGGGTGNVYNLQLFAAFNNTGAAITAYVDSSDRALYIRVGTREFIQDTDIVGLLDGRWHHILFEFDADLSPGGDSGAAFCYVDGAARGFGGFAGGTPTGDFTAQRVAIGPYELAPEGDDWTPEGYQVAHVALYGDTVGQALAISHTAAITAPWDGDTTGERLGRILDLIGVDDDDRDIDTGTQTCGPAVLASQNALQYTQKIKATEGGSWFVSADGKATFRERVENDPTPTFTISDDPVGDSGVPYVTVSPDFSLDRVVNVAKVTREAGDVLTAQNDSSVAAYGARTIELSTLHRSAGAARGRGALLVNQFAEPRVVVDRAVLAGRRSDTPASVTLGAELGDVGLAIMRPTGGGTAIEQLSQLERVEHSMTPQGEWRTTFGFSPLVVLPEFEWDTPGQGWDESVWPAT